MRILAVDDDPVILHLLTEVMKAADYRDVVTAPGAPEALELIEQADEPFGCFLLDIQMPEMDGIELAARIRAMPAYRQTPIVMITAMSDRDHVSRAFAAGATDYVTKPFDVMELCTRVNAAARLVQAQAELEEKQLALAALRNRVTSQERIGILEEIPLTGVRGGLRKLAFENYILQLGRSGLFGCAFIAFRIANIHRIHQLATPQEFRDTILDVGDLLADALKAQEFFISYRGNGIYAAVMHMSAMRARADIAEEIAAELQGMELCLASGAKLTIDLRASRVVQCGLFQPAGTLEPLWKALDEVEEGASTRQAERDAGFRVRVKRITGQIIHNVAS